jgi:spore germination protein
MKLINRKFNKKFKLFFVTIVVLLVLAMVAIQAASNGNFKVPLTLSSWVVYWDEKSGSELLKMDNSLESVSFFAAYFDSKKKLFIPKTNKYQLSDIKKFCEKNDSNLFLTIVNDYITPEGKSSLKDINLLKDLLLSEQSREAHIQDIIKVALEGGYNGVEIDYEGIKNDEDLWKEYLMFCKELYSKASKNNLKIHVILEPSAPVEKYKFPVGPSYIMMAYNLFGSYSGPGPKADIDFINKLCKKMKQIEGEKWIAFATGGFDWIDGNKATSITKSRAEILLSSYNHSEVLVDKNSGCKFFNYSDEKHVNHTVWYADEETFKLWFSTAKKQGYNHFAIWRLEENSSKLNLLMTKH